MSKDTVVVELSKQELVLVARAVSAAERHHEGTWRLMYGEIRERLEAELEADRVQAAGVCCCGTEGT